MSSVFSVTYVTSTAYRESNKCVTITRVSYQIRWSRYCSHSVERLWEITPNRTKYEIAVHASTKRNPSSLLLLRASPTARFEEIVIHIYNKSNILQQRESSLHVALASEPSRQGDTSDSSQNTYIFALSSTNSVMMALLFSSFIRPGTFLFASGLP